MTYGNPIIYWFLKVSLCLTLLLCGYFIAYKDKDDKRYWQISLFAIVFYSLEMGLRWNRSWDYHHYYQDLTGPLYMKYDDVLYLAWVEFFKMTNLPYWIAFIIYSGLFIFSFLVLFRKFPKSGAIWALPLFLLIPNSADNHVRQFFSISFGLLGYTFYLKKKWIKSLTLFACCFLIHFGNFFMIAMILLFANFKFYSIGSKPLLLMTVYTFLYFFWNPDWLSGIADYLTTLDAGETRAQTYLENANYWMSEDSNINEKTGTMVTAAKTYYIMLKVIINNGLIYYGSKAFQKIKTISIFFWSLIVIQLIGVIGGDKEIFFRFIVPLQCFEIILISIIWSSGVLKTQLEKSIFVVLGFYYFGWVSYFRNILIPSPLGYAYIWDL